MNEDSRSDGDASAIQRDRYVLSAFLALKPGESFVLIADHPPCLPA